MEKKIKKITPIIYDKIISTLLYIIKTQRNVSINKNKY